MPNPWEAYTENDAGPWTKYSSDTTPKSVLKDEGFETVTPELQSELESEFREKETQRGKAFNRQAFVAQFGEELAKGVYDTILFPRLIQRGLKAAKVIPEDMPMVMEPGQPLTGRNIPYPPKDWVSRGLPIYAGGTAGKVVDLSQKGVEGLVDFGVDMANFFQTPEGAITLGAGVLPQAARKVAHKALGTVWAGELARHSPEAIQEAKRAVSEGDAREATHALAGVGISVGVPGAFAYKGLRQSRLPVASEALKNFELEPPTTEPKPIQIQTTPYDLPVEAMEAAQSSGLRMAREVSPTPSAGEIKATPEMLEILPEFESQRRTGTVVTQPESIRPVIAQPVPEPIPEGIQGQRVSEPVPEPPISPTVAAVEASKAPEGVRIPPEASKPVESTLMPQDSPALKEIHAQSRAKALAKEAKDAAERKQDTEDGILARLGTDLEFAAKVEAVAGRQAAIDVLDSRIALAESEFKKASEAYDSNAGDAAFDAMELAAKKLNNFTDLRTAVEVYVKRVKPVESPQAAPKTASVEAVEQAAQKVINENLPEITLSKAEAWADATLKKKAGQVNIGLDPELFAAAVIKGAALLTRGVISGTEWSKSMIEQFGPEVRQYLKAIRQQAEEMRVGSFQEQSKEAVGGQGELRMRNLAERASVSTEVPEPMREQIRTDPQSFYKQQSQQDVRDLVSSMSESDLHSTPMIQPDGPNNIWVASQMELFKRAVASGDQAAMDSVFERAEKAGTSFGQLINQFKMLKGASPIGVLQAVNRKLVKEGYDPMTEAQRKKLAGISQESISANDAWKDAERDYVTSRSDADFKRVEKLHDEAVKKDIETQRYVHDIMPRSVPNVLISILQGNFLTPISHVANTSGNVSFLPFRGLVRGTAGVFNGIESYLRNNQREISSAPIGSAKAAISTAISKTRQEAPLIFKEGGSVKGEGIKGLHPLRAWARMLGKDLERPTKGGSVPLRDKVSTALEAIFGMPAEVMLRGLAIGDVPFRNAARGRLVAEQARLKGIPSTDIAKATSFPELFFDKATLELIDRESKQAVFQQESPVSRAILSVISKNDWVNLASRMVAPYITTPVNILGELLSFVPPVALAKAAFAKTPRARATAVGQFVVGSAITASATYLYEKGVIAPSLDAPDEQQKARLLAQEVLPPNHLNISGLKRLLHGEDGAFKKGDKSIDLFRGGGLFGAFAYVVSNIGREIEKSPESKGSDLALQTMAGAGITMAKYAVNQSFLRGVATIMTGLTEGRTDQVIANLWNTVTAIPLPNTLTAISRATRDYKPDFKPDKSNNQLELVLKNRLGVFGTTKDLPLKRNIWGQPIRETPEGSNPFVYQFLDISKAHEVTSDPVNLSIYRLWRKTSDASVIPSPPLRRFTDKGKSFDLDGKQYERLSELIGSERRTIVDRLVRNPDWSSKNDERKIDLLKSAYERGSKIGKTQFLKEFRTQLEKRPGKAGFKE